MKLNWGWSLAIVMGMFITFILYMVFQLQATKTDLYAVDYYQQEVDYQQEIDAKQHAKNYDAEIEIKQTSGGDLKIVFPMELTNKRANGKIYLYRPNNAALDINYPMKPRHINIIPRKELTPGIYLVHLSWEFDGKNYLVERQVYIN